VATPILGATLSTTRLSLSEARALLCRSFEALGAPDSEAAVAAQVCLEAEMLGRATHGLRLVGNISREYVEGAARRAEVAVLRDTDSSAVVDGGFHLSPFVHDLAAGLAREKALATGVAVVGVKNAGVSGALGVHAARIAQSDVVAIAMNSSPSVVVAPGSAQPMLGTNPIAFALPRTVDYPLVLDMATSQISFNGVRVALQRGEDLPASAAVDALGRPTRSAAAAVEADGRGRLLPFGGYRGFGLALIIELLTAGNLSSALGTDKLGPFAPEPSYFPGTYLAYRADLLAEPGSLQCRVDRLVAELSASGARVPGTSSTERRAKALATDTVVVDDKHLADLHP